MAIKKTLQLTIDVGNTHSKTAVFISGRFTSLFVFQMQGELIEFVKARVPDQMIISNVGRQDNLLKALKMEVSCPIIVLTWQTPLPIKNNYQTPQTLGMDRLAAATGAAYVCSNQPCLIIDAGSCITYDFLDEHQQYQGGNISPGINIRFQAMHAFTASLPLIHLDDLTAVQLESPGSTTQSAMVGGVLLGMMDEIEGMIKRYTIKYPDLQVIITGGDAQYFEKGIKQPIFAIPELVHLGLHRILEFNNA